MGSTTGLVNVQVFAIAAVHGDAEVDGSTGILARVYTRPELTAQDVKAFQRAKCVAINPARDKVANYLALAEKGCQKRLLPLSEALSAFDAFVESGAHSVFAGNHECAKQMQYPLQCTVLQLVQLTDSIVGLICDRQHVLPGKKSRPPLVIGADGVFSGRSPVMRLEEVLSYFWPYLSDTDIDAMHQQCTTHVMSTLVPARIENEARQAEQRRQRRRNIEVLFRGVKPEFTTEFSHCCNSIAADLTAEGNNSIAWSELKKRYPGYATRYKARFLSLLNKALLTVDALRNTSNQTDFDCRITTWRGESRIFDAPQLVMQIRNIPVHWRFLKESRAHQELSSLIKAEARRSSHPATENTIGWIRVHVDDDNKLCFVDEVQSDAMELALEYTRKAGYEDAAKAFIAECRHWHLHAFATVSQWAESIGYRAAIHSRDSASQIEFMTRSDRKWSTYYGSIVKQFGLRKSSVPGYPSEVCVAGYIG